MLVKSLTLLLLLAALLDVPEVLAQRTRPVNRTSLFREQQARQAGGVQKKLISRNRINPNRRSKTVTIATTEATTTTTTTPAPPPVTEEPFTDFTAILGNTDFTDVSDEFVPTPAPEQIRLEVEPVRQSVAEQEEAESDPAPVIPQIRPLEPEPVAQEEPIRQRRPITRPRPALRPRPVAQPLDVEPLQETGRAAAEPVAPVAKPPPAKTKTRPSKSEERKPVVETVRRYSFESDDGSFTFGYENADGSFKEETRGADCVVRGKYGYIDPDGVKREFSYVSGNPCTKDKPEEEDDNSGAENDSEEEERPQLPVRRPNIPQRTAFINTPRPALRPAPVAVPSALDFDASAEEEVNIPKVNQERTRPISIRLPQRQQRPQPIQPEEQPERNADEGRRPVFPVPAAVPRPQFNPNPAPAPAFDFASEVQRLSGSLPAPPPAAPAPAPVPAPIPGGSLRRPIPPQDEQEDDERSSRPTGSRSFTSELVFDRNSNQFRTAVVQRIPEENRDISIKEQLVGFVPSTKAPATPEPTPAPPTTPVRVRVPTPAPEVPRVAPTPAPTAAPAAPVTPAPAAPAALPAGTFRPSDFDFNSFGPPPQEVDRIRKEHEERLRQEAQRFRQQEEQRRREEELQRAEEQRRQQEQQQFRQGFRPQPFPGAQPQPFPGAPQPQQFAGAPQPQQFPGGPQREQFPFNPVSGGQGAQQFFQQPQQFRGQPFGGQPSASQFSGRQQQQQPFPPANPFAPGLSLDQFFRQQPQQQPPAFRPPQPQQFAPQVAQPQNAANRAQSARPVAGPTSAAGQIDSFLSSLSG